MNKESRIESEISKWKFDTNILLISLLFFLFFQFCLQVEFCTMCRAKCAAITVRASIMVFLHAMDAQAFSNVRFVVHAIMNANRNRAVIAWWTKRIGISAVLADCASASKSA